MTVRSPTVTSKCWALLRSTFFNLGLVFLWLFFLLVVSFSLFSFSTLSFFSFFDCVGGTNCWVTCWATNWETGRGFLKLRVTPRYKMQLRCSHLWSPQVIWISESLPSITNEGLTTSFIIFCTVSVPPSSNLSYPIGSFPSQIHLSCPSVQHENLPDGHPLELPEIGNFNGSLVLEAFTITSKNVDLWRLPNRRTPVTGKWSSLFFFLGTECPLDFWWVAQSLFSFNPNDNASLSPPQVMFPPLKKLDLQELRCTGKKISGAPIWAWSLFYTRPTSLSGANSPVHYIPSSSRCQVFSLFLLFWAATTYSIFSGFL